jgi:hypothetical protein
MTSIARDLTLAETDHLPSEQQRLDIISWANEGRAQLGLPALTAGK